MPANEREGVVFRQPKTEEERVKVAGTCQARLDIKIPILIDGMDNAVNEAYSGWPDRLYVIDKTGKIAYKGGPGPRGFRPREMAQALEKLLESP